jgi:hypothetical protein
MLHVTHLTFTLTLYNLNTLCLCRSEECRLLGVREQSVELKGEAEGTARSQNKTLEKQDRRQQGHEGWRGGATRWRRAVKQSPLVHDRRLGVHKLNCKGVKGSLDSPVIVFDGMAVQS